MGVERIFDMTRLDRVAAYLSNKLNRAIELPVKNKAPEVVMQLGEDRKQDLRRALAKDYALYDRVQQSDGELITQV